MLAVCLPTGPRAASSGTVTTSGVPRLPGAKGLAEACNVGVITVLRRDGDAEASRGWAACPARLETRLPGTPREMILPRGRCLKGDRADGRAGCCGHVCVRAAILRRTPGTDGPVRPGSLRRPGHGVTDEVVGSDPRGRPGTGLSALSPSSYLESDCQQLPAPRI